MLVKRPTYILFVVGLLALCAQLPAQTSKTCPGGVTVSPTSIVFPATAGGTGSFTYTIPPGCKLLSLNTLPSTQNPFVSGPIADLNPGTYTYNMTTTETNTSGKTYIQYLGFIGGDGIQASPTITLTQPSAGGTPLTLTCPAANTGTAGTAYSSSLTAAGGTPPYQFLLSQGSLPPGLGLNSSTGAIAGTPTATGSYSFTAMVRDSTAGTPQSATASCSISVAAPITLACPAGIGAAAGVPYSSHLTATGGVLPYQFSITEGNLPPGLVLDANTGAVTGTPGAPGSFSFTATVVDSSSGTPLSTTAACAIAVAKITMDSLQITQPATKNAVDGTVPAVTPVTSTNTSAAFATAGSADLVAVLLNSGTVTVNGINVQPAANAGNVQWQMDRDPTDKIDLSTAPGCAASPSGAPAVAGSPGAQVTFSPNTPGNFRLAAYVDLNGNGKFDDGEQLRILRVAIVRATLMNPATSTFKTTKDFVPDAPAGGKAGVDAKGPAMQLLGDYMIEGGGATCTVGATQITIGNVGNLNSDNFAVNYPVPNPAPPAPGNVAGTSAENPGGPLPMVDTSRVAKGNQPGGGDQAFRSSSTQTNKASATGRRISLASKDSPGYGFWKINHPATNNPWATTTGGNVFREFVVAFSSSFPRTYSSLNENNWTLNVKGKNDGTGKWTDDGASVTGNDTKLTAVADSVQVLGLSFVREFSYVCTPAPPAGTSCN